MNTSTDTVDPAQSTTAHPEPQASGGAMTVRSESRRIPWHASIALFASLALSLAGLAGCVRRTLKITTDPPQALVYLNDQEVGRSEVSTDFLWYGDYDVVIRQDGYQTLHTHWNVEPPWYQVMPLDFFFEVLWPGKLHDVHERHFEMLAAEPTDPEALIERAMVTRDRALDPTK